MADTQKNLNLSDSGTVDNLLGLFSGVLRQTPVEDLPVSTATQAEIDLKTDVTIFEAHSLATNNPHDTTKAQVGLGNVDNTADVDKPISTAMQSALDALPVPGITLESGGTALELDDSVEDGSTFIKSGNSLVQGPDADEIANAQGYALAAGQYRDEAGDSAESAKLSSAAAGVASGRNIVATFAELATTFNYDGSNGRRQVAADDRLLVEDLNDFYLVLDAGAAAADFDYTGSGGVKLNAIVAGYSSAKTLGANGDGTTDNKSALDKTAAAAKSVAPLAARTDETYLFSSQWILKSAISLSGTGTLKTTAVDEHILAVADISNPGSLIGPLSIYGLSFKQQPASATDNYAGISLANVDQPKVLSTWEDDVETGIRLGYVAAGQQCNAPITALNHIQGARTFGIEHISAKRPVTLGNVIQNKGVQVGNHGLRYTSDYAEMDGFVSVGNLVADRANNGISVQSNVKHGLFSAVIDNVAADAFRANLTAIEAQQHLGQFVILNAGNDAVRLNDLSHCMIDAATSGSGGMGARVGGAADDGHHIVRVQSLEDGNAVLVRSNHNHVTVVADKTTEPSAVLVSGSYNIIDVIATDTQTLSLYVTGPDNIIRVIETGSASVGLRVNSDHNHITANISSTVDIDGSNNVFSGRFSGSVFIDAGASGNDFSSVLGFSRQGRVTATTDASGEITFAHGLHAAAWAGAAVNVTVHGDNDYTARVKSVSSTNIIVVVKDAAGADVDSTSVTLSWQAAYKT